MGNVIASYHRTKNLGLAERFYEKLLSADARIKAAFANTDFEQQKKLFTQGLLMLLQYSDGKPVGQMAIRRLSGTHGTKGMNIPPSLYAIWIHCLVSTVAEIDPEYSKELGEQWGERLKLGVNAMKATSH